MVLIQRARVVLLVKLIFFAFSAFAVLGVFLSVYGFVLPTHKAKAANPAVYYVDNTGSDANDGLSDVTPWQTIDKVNHSTFNPGDQILLKKGGVWRETLTVPSSGDSSNRIVFGSYGLGDRPEINASQQILNSDFSFSSTVPSVAYSNTLNVDSTAAGIRNYRMICPVTISSNTTKIRLNASATVDWHVTAVSISEQLSTVAATATPVQILWDSGSVSTTITANTSKDSDVLNFPVTAGHTYLVHIYMADKHYKGSSTLSYYYDSITASNESLLQTPTGSQLASGPLNGGPVSAILGDNVNIYKVASATDPLAVWENGEFLAKKTSALTGILGQWYWDGIDLYVCANDGGNIITGGKTYEKVNLLYTINDNSQSWLEFKDINSSRAGQSGATVVGVRNGGANNLWHDMEIYSNLGHAISIMQGSINCRIYNMNLHDSSSTTIVAIFGNQELNQTTGNYLEYSELYQANPNCVSTPIVIHGKANGNYVQYNDIHLDVAYQTSLIMTYDDETSNTIRYNYLHYTGGRIFHAIYVYDGSADGSTPTNGGGPNYIYGNIIDMRGQTGILAQEGIYFWNALGSSEVYNNTILMTNASYAAIGATNSPNLTIKNNIIDAPFNMNIDANSQTGLVSDYNDFYYASGISLKWGATAYATLANWRTNSSQDAHSINADPKFVNSASDYNLQATSPAIDAGFDTSIVTDYVGKVRYDDPAVANSGAGTLTYYDIGAYEYPYPAATVPSAPTVTATSASALTIVINSNGNADWAEYAIYNETMTKYVQADGTLGDTAVWQTRTLWGGDSGIINTGLSANTDYNYKVKARNGDHAETAFSASASESTPSSIPISVTATALSTVSIKLDWVSGGSQNKFNVYRNGMSGTGVLVHSADDLTYTDTGLAASTSYIYYVYSVDDDGAESPSNISVTISTLSDPVISQTSSPSSDSTSSISPTVPSTSDFSVSSNSDEVTFTIPSGIVMDANITFEAPETLGGSQILKYTWDLGDGTISTNKNIEHQYQKPGQYIVTLRVTAQNGRTSVKVQTVDVNPSKPTVESITTEGNDIVISGKSYPGTTVYLEIHSDPISAQAIADANGLWTYRLADAKDTLGVGDHTVSASASYTLADSTQLKSESSKTYDFKVSLDDGQTKVEMKKTRLWQVISVIAGIVIILLLGFLVYRRKRGQRK